MSTTHRSLKWGQLLSVLLSVLAFAIAEDCIIPKTFPHFISVETSVEVDSHMCYKCYSSPTSEGLQVDVHELRLGGLGSVMMYVDGTPRRFTEDCGECETENFIEVDEDGGLSTRADAQCRKCDAMPRGNLVELYIRLNQVPIQEEEEENPCSNLPNILVNFNISLSLVANEKDSETSSPNCDGGYSVNFPTSGDTCVVNATLSVGEARCVVPTCVSQDLSNEKIEHKFLPSNPPQTCLWSLDTEQRKHLTLKFTENIRPHLTLFEDALSNPKWDIEWCPAFTNEFRFETNVSKIYIVYHNSQKLSKKGSFFLSAQDDLCLLPPKLENGNVVFKHLESGTVAHYSCDRGFTLLGLKELRCKSSVWDKPPICLPVDEDKLMSDAPMGSNESFESVNGSVLVVSENDTSLSADSEAQGKMAKRSSIETRKKRSKNKPDTVLFDMEDSGHKADDDGTKEDEEEAKTAIEDGTGMEGDDNRGHSNRTVLTSMEDDSGEVSAGGNTSLPGDVMATGRLDLKGLKILKELLQLEDDMTLYLVIGSAGLLVVIVILIISIIIYRKKYPVRLGLGRKFDTFQNPIYEKTVVQMPMQIEETEVGRKKSDAEEISDCTVLE